MTRRSAIDAALIAAIAVLGYFNISAGLERSRLAAIVERAPRPPSDLDIGDRAYRHVRAVRTLDPHQFAWQVYLPPGTAFARGSTGPKIAVGDAVEGYEWQVRVGFREAPDGGFLINTQSGGSNSEFPLGGRALGDLLRGRWDQLVVEQAGRDRLVVADPAAPLRLLRLSLRPSLLAEARAALAPGDFPALPVLFEFTIEPTGAQP